LVTPCCCEKGWCGREGRGGERAQDPSAWNFFISVFMVMSPVGGRSVLVHGSRSCSAYFFSHELARLSFIVGVSSSSSAVSWVLEQAELLHLFDTGELACSPSSISFQISVLDFLGERVRLAVVRERHIVILRELLDVLLVDHDQHRQVRARLSPMIDRVRHIRRELELVLPARWASRSCRRP
jgi:hypothetical protein